MIINLVSKAIGLFRKKKDLFFIGYFSKKRRKKGLHDFLNLKEIPLIIELIEKCHKLLNNEFWKEFFHNHSFALHYIDYFLLKFVILSSKKSCLGYQYKVHLSLLMQQYLMQSLNISFFFCIFFCIFFLKKKNLKIKYTCVFPELGGPVSSVISPVIIPPSNSSSILFLKNKN